MNSAYDKYNVNVVDKINYFNASIYSVINSLESDDVVRSLEILTDLLKSFKDCAKNEYVENIKNILCSVCLILDKGKVDNIRVIHILKNILINQ